ncbi:DUF2505 domain-containing protein [Tomitella biformata]|uniref:DUF2505 domain-containing protein n=1 Tax=Tomitella biformata TaxID=630403 RepID=UPI000466B1C9|nr:DUF2505 domain-containing protein [Tomitella biformata]
MARRIDYTAQLSSSAAQAYAALANRDYWEALMTRMRELTPTSVVEEFTSTDAGIDLVMMQVIEKHTLPTVAQTVLQSDLVITRTAHYGPFVPGGITTGSFTATMPGAPGSLDGEIALFDDGDGSVLRTSPEAKVNIPLLGGKLEEMMLDNLVGLLEVENEFTNSWLLQNR